MIEQLSPEARTFLSDFLNQIDYEKDQTIKEKDKVINELLSRVAKLEYELEEKDV